MYTLRTLTWAAIKMFLRNRQALFFTFFFPIFLMTVLGLINFDKTSKIDVGIVLNAPPTAGTTQFLDAVRSVPLFNVHLGSGPDEDQALIDDKRAVVFSIPFDLVPGPATVTAKTNGGQAQAAATAPRRNRLPSVSPIPAPCADHETRGNCLRLSLAVCVSGLQLCR